MYDYSRLHTKSFFSAGYILNGASIQSLISVFVKKSICANKPYNNYGEKYRFDSTSWTLKMVHCIGLLGIFFLIPKLPVFKYKTMTKEERIGQL